MEPLTPQPSVRQVADAIGRKRLAEALGVRTTAVSNAVVRMKFPAPWFVTVDCLAREKGIACPLALFGFIESSTPSTTPTQEPSHDQPPENPSTAA